MYGQSRPKVLISIFDTNHFGYQTAPTHPGTLTKATTNSLKENNLESMKLNEKRGIRTPMTHRVSHLQWPCEPVRLFLLSFWENNNEGGGSFEGYYFKVWINPSQVRQCGRGGGEFLGGKLVEEEEWVEGECVAQFRTPVPSSYTKPTVRTTVNRMNIQ